MVCKVSPGLEYTYTSLCGMWCCLGLQRLCGRRGRHRGEGIALQCPGCLDTERKSSDIRASSALGVLSLGAGVFRRRLPKFPTASSSKATLTTAQTNKVINKSDLITFCMKSCWAIVGRKTNVLPIFTDLTFLYACAEVLWPPLQPSHSLRRSLCILIDPSVGTGYSVTPQSPQFWRLPREAPHSVLSSSWKKSHSAALSCEGRELSLFRGRRDALDFLTERAL